MNVPTIFSLKYLLHAFAGGVGNAISISIFFPLETARTRLQVQKNRKSQYSFILIHKIWKEEGLNGVYRGWFSLVVTSFLTWFTYFYVFHGLKAMLSDGGMDQQMFTDLIFGLTAGCIAVLVTNPFWVINTRLKLQYINLRNEDKKMPKYSGMYDCLGKILLHEDLYSLWSGTRHSIILCCNPAINSMVYELCKRTAQFMLQTSFLGNIWHFILGAFAKLVATIVTYPLQVVQTRQRAGLNDQAYGDNKNYNSSLLGIIHNEGFRGLFSGLEAKLSQTVLTAALMFTVYEDIVFLVFNAFGIPQKLHQ